MRCAYIFIAHNEFEGFVTGWCDGIGQGCHTH
jgi:hypothetical protein